jgi:hypothetical protein
MKRTRLALGPVCAGLFFVVTASGAIADERCQQLEALNRQYAGVTLTSSQQQLKRKLVAWYFTNCRNRTVTAAARD